jgi:hypothetical protein
MKAPAREPPARLPGEADPSLACSDDTQVEPWFSILSNVAMHRKRAYIEKMIEGGWNAVTVDHNGRQHMQATDLLGLHRQQAPSFDLSRAP